MNDKSPSELIDERELRAALRPLRPDRSAFEVTVRQLMDAKRRSRDDLDSDDAKLEHSDWLQVAASVIPLPLLCKGTSGSLAKFSLGQLSLGQKLVAITALPAVTLMLMVTATIWAYVQVHRAHRGQQTGNIDPQRMVEVTARWWRVFGVLVVGMAGMSVLLMLVGYAIPVFVFFLVSGITMVSLITRLARNQMIDRGAIGGSFCAGMFLLAQVAQVFTMWSPGSPFLDQTLIMAILMAGGLVVLMLSFPFAQFSRIRKVLVALSLAAVVVLLVGWFSSSLWNPISKIEMKEYVESFDDAPFSSASWRQWKTPAAWLRDCSVPLDMTEPRKLLETEIEQEKQNATILHYAFETDLIQPQDLNRLRELDEQKERMFSESKRGDPFISIAPTGGVRESYVIRALAMRDELSENERDFLAERLTVTMQALHTEPLGYLLAEQLAITKLSLLIDRPLDIDSHRQWVHQTLVKFQRLDSRLGVRRGGFASTPALDFSDACATVDAIELMQFYGVPNDVEIDALRSYLRPTAHDQWVPDQSSTRVASLQRLESLPEVSPITWRDFLAHEQNLIMAILFVLLCVFATVGAPKQRTQAP